MSKLKGFISIFMILVFMFPQMIVLASNSIKEADEFLLSIGMPQDVINSLTETKRYEIFRNMTESAVEDIVFDSFTQKGYDFLEHDEEPIQTFSITIEYGDLIIPYVTIPSSDLRLSVIAGNGILNGQPVTLIYPSFTWQRAVNLRNDGFAIALFPGWEVVAGANVNMRLWAIDTRNGSRHSFSDHAPTNATAAGYAFRFNTGSTMGGIFRFEGIATITARNTGANAARSISLNYAHDTSSLFNTSFSFGIGPASISINGGGNSLRTMAGNFRF